MKTRFAGVAGTVQRFVLLRWLKSKVLREFAAYEHGMRLWKHSVGWDRGGSAMPGWVSANETSDQNALREDSWHHFKLARMYNIARRRTKKQNAGLLKPSTTRLDSCDFCEAQEAGGHSCLLHSCQLKNANLWTCPECRRCRHRLRTSSDSSPAPCSQICEFLRGHYCKLDYMDV